MVDPKKAKRKPIPEGLQKIIDARKRPADKYWDETTQSYKSRKEEKEKERKQAKDNPVYREGGQVRGAGIAQRGVRKAKYL